MEIVEYERKYVEALSKLFYNTVHVINAQDYSEDQIEAWAPINQDLHLLNERLSETYCLVLIKDNIIVAYGNITNDGLIDHLYVHHLYQGQGHGKILLESLENHLANSNCYNTYASITSVSFFKNNGYKIVKENKVNIRGIELVNFYMRKEA